LQQWKPVPGAYEREVVEVVLERDTVGSDAEPPALVPSPGEQEQASIGQHQVVPPAREDEQRDAFALHRRPTTPASAHDFAVAEHTVGKSRLRRGIVCGLTATPLVNTCRIHVVGVHGAAHGARG
jgi:hypothetical protein